MITDSTTQPTAYLCIEQLKASADSAPIVAISGCLLGESVRYDGGHKSLEQCRDPLRECLTLISVCPEMAAGMGVPRPPVHWVETPSGEQQLQQVDDPQRQFHEPLKQACDQWLSQHPYLDACILKARSPSCGSGTTPIVNTQQQWLRNSDGQFVRSLRQHHPAPLILDESKVQTQADCYWLICLLYLKRHPALRTAAGVIDNPDWEALLDWTEPQRQRCYQQLLKRGRAAGG